MSPERLLRHLEHQLNALRLHNGLDAQHGDYSGVDYLLDRIDQIRRHLAAKERRILARRREQTRKLLGYALAKRPHLAA